MWNGNFPTSLGGASVTVDSKLAYLWFVSSGQINFQAPDDTATGPVPVVVSTAAGTATSTVTLAQVAPSVSCAGGWHARHRHSVYARYARQQMSRIRRDLPHTTGQGGRDTGRLRRGIRAYQDRSGCRKRLCECNFNYEYGLGCDRRRGRATGRCDIFRTSRGGTLPAEYRRAFKSRNGG